MSCASPAAGGCIAYQVPHGIEFVDSLPKTVTGKILRYQLRNR